MQEAFSSEGYFYSFSLASFCCRRFLGYAFYCVSALGPCIKLGSAAGGPSSDAVWMFCACSKGNRLQLKHPLVLRGRYRTSIGVGRGRLAHTKIHTASSMSKTGNRANSSGLVETLSFRASRA
jgi:hypothetical protein